MNVLLYGSISRLLFQTEYIRISFPVVSIVSLFLLFSYFPIRRYRKCTGCSACVSVPRRWVPSRTADEADGGQQMWRDVPKRLFPLPALTDSTQHWRLSEGSTKDFFSFFLFEGAMHRWCAAQHEMGRHRGKRRTTPGHFIAIPPPSFSH
jgi:hypothetical protein